MVDSEDETIVSRGQHVGVKTNQERGFSLLELLVVISIISTLMAIMLPAFGRVRRAARTVASANNQKQITGAVNIFALDNDDRYPASVATVGFGDSWNWSDPTKLTGNRERSPGVHRSMSAYLRSYVADADTMYCPSAPHKYKYLQQAWDAGDDWDNPETSFPSDPVGGTYCFYWNYTGFLGGRRVVFKGPRGPAGGYGHSKLLVSDYFGYDHWRSPGAYGSCEKFEGADIAAETWLLSAYWSKDNGADVGTPEIKLQAGYTDGHVESYSASDVVPMKVAITSDGTVPYPDGVGPGIVYLPGNALH
jgi:prepilin-type N-terminal cleavage/methylation domain-containing protein